MDSVLSESLWQWDPKVGDLYLATTKPWETVVEVGSSPDVQIALSQLGIGAKDSPNHLVAGFPRSFPQDSWSWETATMMNFVDGQKKPKKRRRLCRVKKCMRGTRFLLSFFRLFWKKECKRKWLFGEHHFTQSSTYPQTVKWHVLSLSFFFFEKKKKRTNQYPLPVCDLSKNEVLLQCIPKNGNSVSVQKEEKSLVVCLFFVGHGKEKEKKKKKVLFLWNSFYQNRLCGSKWATTGKQYWRRGMNRKHIFRVTVLAHVRSQKGCCLLVIAGRWPWRLESAQESCNNSPAEACTSQNGWRQSQRETKKKSIFILFGCWTKKNNNNNNPSECAAKATKHRPKKKTQQKPKIMWLCLACRGSHGSFLSFVFCLFLCVCVCVCVCGVLRCGEKEISFFFHNVHHTHTHTRKKMWNENSAEVLWAWADLKHLSVQILVAVANIQSPKAKKKEKRRRILFFSLSFGWGLECGAGFRDNSDWTRVSRFWAKVATPLRKEKLLVLFDITQVWRKRWRHPTFCSHSVPPFCLFGENQRKTNKKIDICVCVIPETLILKSKRKKWCREWGAMRPSRRSLFLLTSLLVGDSSLARRVAKFEPKRKKDDVCFCGCSWHSITVYAGHRESDKKRKDTFLLSFLSRASILLTKGPAEQKQRKKNVFPRHWFLEKRQKRKFVLPYRITAAGLLGQTSLVLWM